MDGRAVKVVELGQSNMNNTTVLHVPSLEMVVPSDAMDECFQYLVERDTEGLRGECYEGY